MHAVANAKGRSALAITRGTSTNHDPSAGHQLAQVMTIADRPRAPKSPVRTESKPVVCHRCGREYRCNV